MMNPFSSLSVSFEPLLPPWLLILLGVLSLIGLGLMAWRRARGLAWRTATLAALALLLLDPALVREDRHPLKDVAVVVVDTSASQAVGHRRERTDAALAALKEKLSAMPDLDLRVVEAGTSTAGGKGEETRAIDALTQAVADVPRRRLAGAILLTDGQVHDVPEKPENLADLGPVHTLLTGERGEGDRRLVLVRGPSYGIVGKTVTATVRVEDLPLNANGAGKGPADGALLTIRQDGQPERQVPVPVGEDVPLTVTVGHGGPNLLELSVNAGPAELSMANNRTAFIVNGVRDRLRVLLVSGEPHAGERTWRDLLKADPAVDLVHFTILRSQEKSDSTPIRELSLIQFPIRELFEVKLNDFDLVIFDRYRQRNVLPMGYLANIAEYVRNGGAFLEASGPAYATPLSLYRTPLGDILPGEPTGTVTEQPYTPTLTAAGRRHPVTAGLDGYGESAPAASPAGGPAGSNAQKAPWGRWFRQIDIVPRQGTVVMNGANNRPLVVLDRVGKGRVAQIASDHMWLWSRGFEGGGPAAELLRRLAHWLMKEPALEEDDLKAHVDGDRLVVERRSLKPDADPVEVRSPSDAVTTLPLADSPDGVARGSLPATEPGLWRVKDGDRTALAVVGALNPPELADMRTTPDRLAPLAKATGGGVFWLADGLPDLRRVNPGQSAAGSGWLGLRANGDYTVTGVARVPLVPAWLALLALAALLVLGWRREGR
ncbi:membrane protein [Azospirillum sp. B4]|uniref:membrane protein n=1 Tax=Azospirillum sp. B4 TaxID=95605 RepID=UPI00034B6D5F|nr:membrane protein [Azospirillum sp. B4]